MNLWLQAHFLLAGLILCSSAPTKEECETLLQPVSLKDAAMFNGRWNTITAFAEGLYEKLMSSVESSWMNTVAVTSDGATTLQMRELNKINGKCIAANNTIRKVDDTMVVSYTNITSTFVVLPSSDDVMVFSANSTLTGNIDALLHVLNFNITDSSSEGSIRSIYLMSPAPTVKDSDMEQFKKQAGCLGFDGEPVFQYDPKNGFCSEDGSVHVDL